MKRRETWGISLLLSAAACAWAYQATYSASRAAARDGLLLYVGIPGRSVASWFLVAALLSGAGGLSFLLPAIIGRIPKKMPRRTVGWITGLAAAAAVPFFGLMFFFAALTAFGINDTVKIVAADGQSVLITQDGFDGDIINVYTEHDGFHYKLVRNDPEISTWPRVKDQNCRLDTADDELQLLCGDKTVVVEQDDPGG